MHAADLGITGLDDAGQIDEGVGRAVWIAAALSALGGLLFGYDWVVIGGAKPFYEASFGLVEPARQAWAVSSALLGCLVGAIVSGRLADRFGRRPALLSAALIFTVSSLGTALAGGFSSFVAWRILGGVAIGMASGLSPLYIAEIAPARSRGLLVCLNQFAIVVGILAAQVVNLLIAQPVAHDATLADIAASWNGTTGWRWMFAANIVPSIAFVVGCMIIPESPRWLGLHGRESEARQVFTRFLGPVQAERAMTDLLATRPTTQGMSLAAVLRHGGSRRALLIGMVLAALQQWCGINVIFNYAQEIFASAGYAVSDTLFNIVITGVVNFTFTLVAFGTVERLGRRRLLLLGCAALAIIYVALGCLYLRGSQGWPMLVLVVAAIACYAMTLAPVTWVALSEIFPGEARGVCMSIATTTLWAACFALTYTFPLLNAAAGTGATFLLYASICACGFVFILSFLPETRGKSLEEIEQGWR